VTTTQGAGERPAQGEGVEIFRALESQMGSTRLSRQKASRKAKMRMTQPELDRRMRGNVLVRCGEELE